MRRPVLILGGAILSAPERGTDSLLLVLYRDEFLGRVLIISSLNWKKKTNIDVGITAHTDQRMHGQSSDVLLFPGQFSCI